MAFHQLHRGAGGTGEQPPPASHVDHHAVVVDDDAADVALHHRLEHRFGRHRDAGVGLAAQPVEVRGGDVVGEGDQPVPGEQDLLGVLVDEDVDHRLGCAPAGGRGGRPPEDLVHGIEPTLRIGSGQQRGGRIGTVEFGAGSDVLAELVLDEALEDPEHLCRGHRRPTARAQIECAADLVCRHGPVGVVRLGIAFGAVLVGERLPASHEESEVVERQLLTLREQQVEHLPDLRPAARVAGGAGELAHLRGAQMAGEHGVTDLFVFVEEAGHLLRHADLLTGPVEVCAQPAGDAQVAVVAVDAAGLRQRDQGCGLGVDATPLQFELSQTFGHRIVVESLELVDKAGEHVMIVANTRSFVNPERVQMYVNGAVVVGRRGRVQRYR